MVLRQKLTTAKFSAWVHGVDWGSGSSSQYLKSPEDPQMPPLRLTKYQCLLFRLKRCYHSHPMLMTCEQEQNEN